MKATRSYNAYKRRKAISRANIDLVNENKRFFYSENVYIDLYNSMEPYFYKNKRQTLFILNRPSQFVQVKLLRNKSKRSMVIKAIIEQKIPVENNRYNINMKRGDIDAGKEFINSSFM